MFVTFNQYLLVIAHPVCLKKTGMNNVRQVVKTLLEGVSHIPLDDFKKRVWEKFGPGEMDVFEDRDDVKFYMSRLLQFDRKHPQHQEWMFPWLDSAGNVHIDAIPGPP